MRGSFAAQVRAPAAQDGECRSQRVIIYKNNKNKYKQENTVFR